MVGGFDYVTFKYSRNPVYNYTVRLLISRRLIKIMYNLNLNCNHLNKVFFSGVSKMYTTHN